MDNIPSISPMMWYNLQALQGHPSCCLYGLWWRSLVIIASFFLMECAFDYQSRVPSGINTKNTILDCEIPVSLSPASHHKDVILSAENSTKSQALSKSGRQLIWSLPLLFLAFRHSLSQSILHLDQLSIFHHLHSEWESLENVAWVLSTELVLKIIPFFLTTLLCLESR